MACGSLNLQRNQSLDGLVLFCFTAELTHPLTEILNSHDGFLRGKAAKELEDRGNHFACEIPDAQEVHCGCDHIPGA